MSFKRFFFRNRWDDERARELAAYLAIETDENIARGMAPDAARLAAQRKLGSATRIREEIYAMNSVPLVETARLDVRDAWRQLRRRPLSAVVALVIITIGIAASSMAFSVAYGVLLRPLPYPDADRLAVLAEEVRGARGQLSYPDFQDVRQAIDFDAAVAFGSGRATLTGGAEADRVNVVDTDPALLSMLGAHAVVGRLLRQEDAGHAVAVISYRLWQSVFGGTPGILGKPIGVSGTQAAIVGVAAPGLAFELPVDGATVGAGFTIKDVDLWMPLLGGGAQGNRAISTYEALVKLKPDQTIASVQAALDVAAGGLARAYPATNRNRGFRLTPFHRQMVGAKSPALLVGCAGAALILLVAFTNLIGLFLGELPARRHDLALREALGASRITLVRQIAVESAMLALAGGAAGLLVARALVGALKVTAGLPRLDAIRFDLPVTVAAVAVALAIGIVSRVLPLARLRPAQEGLQSSIATYALSAPMLRRSLVAVQLALAVVLSSTATLLGLSLYQLVRVDPGFAAAHVLSLRASAYPARYSQKADVVRFFHQAVARVAGLPGIEWAAAGSGVPLAGNQIGTAVGVEGQPVALADRPTAGWQTVTPGYFATLGIPVVKGRDFAASDLDRPAHQAAINEALARRLFGDANPIGRRLTFGADQGTMDWHEVIAVVGDVRHASLTEPGTPRAYDLFGQHWGRTMYLVSRTQVDPYSVVPAVRGVVRELDPEAPVFDVQSLDDVVAGAMSPRRLATGFAIGIAVVSLLLATIGLYGLLAGSVAARMKELGIRRALGSSTRALMGLVFADAAWLAALGLTAGVAVSCGASHWIEAQLFGVRAADPRAVAVIAGALFIAGAAAVYLPARRAAHVDPAVALRHE